MSTESPETIPPSSMSNAVATGSEVDVELERIARAFIDAEAAYEAGAWMREKGQAANVAERAYLEAFPPQRALAALAVIAAAQSLRRAMAREYEDHVNFDRCVDATIEALAAWDATAR